MHRTLPRALIIAAALVSFVGCSDEASEGSGQDADATDAASDTQGAAPDAADAAPDAADAATDAAQDTCEAGGCGASCGDGVCEAGEAGTCDADCDPTPRAVYDPLGGRLLDFPDDALTVVDATSATGLRVALDLEGEAVAAMGELFRSTPETLNTLDGFGTSAGAYLSFSRGLDPATLTSGESSAGADSTVVFGYLDATGALVRVPVEVSLVDRARTVIMRPMVPLPPKTRAMAVVTTGAAAPGGEAAQANARLRALLEGAAEGPLERLEGRYAEAVAAMVEAGALASAEDVASMVVFTTQSIWEDNAAIVDAIKQRAPRVIERLGCEARAGYRECAVRFEAGYYRDAEGAVALGADGGPREHYALTLQVYLPLEDTQPGAAPYRTLLFGHGLGGSRRQAGRMARRAAPRGMATVAIDAPHHGDHPLAIEADELGRVLTFLGVDTETVRFEAVWLRDNWRQATHDKLALVELLTRGEGLDVDGDGAPDLAPAPLVYVGASLGAIMGPELLALSDQIPAAVLIIGGARVIDIVRTPMFLPLIELVKPGEMSLGDLDRFWVMTQTAIERGDPANHARHVFLERLDDAPPVQVLDAMVFDDQVVPRTTNLMLARSLGVPHVPPVLVPAGVIGVEPAAPVEDNLAGVGTVGLLQFAWVLEGEQWVEATHDDISETDEGMLAWFSFIEAFVERGVGEIIDPYAALDRTPPPPPPVE